MVLTLKITSQQEETLRREASKAGMDVASYAASVLTHSLPAQESIDQDAPSLLDRLKKLGVVGAVKGTSGPGDGRSWSEIEAACDPL